MYLDKESVSPPAPVPSGVRFLSGSQIRALLRYDDCVTAMDLAMRAVSAGGCLLPPRQVLAVAANPPHFGIMSGFLDDPACFGVKVVGLLSGHGRGGASSRSGLMLLFGAQSGCPVAILDASEPTRIRTSAISVVATRTLARSESRTLAILGAGEQASEHLAAMTQLLPWESVACRARPCRRESGSGNGTAQRDRNFTTVMKA